jgi:hypothetical protein
VPSPRVTVSFRGFQQPDRHEPASRHALV